MEKLIITIMPESVTGYRQVFLYSPETGICEEKRKGFGRGCFTVYDSEVLSQESWEKRIESFKKMVARLKSEAPEYTFEIEYIGE